MSPSLIAALVWMIAGNVAGMIPSRDGHRARARVLIATGLPILAWVFWQAGPLAGLVCLAAGASVLRWPLRFLFGWLRRLFGGGPETPA